MITYSIGEVAKRTGMTTHTLRYYEKEGLLPVIHKNSSGARRFNEHDMECLEVLECLKSTGLPLKEIKLYMDLRQKGDTTLNERLQIFIRQKKRLEDQILVLNESMDKINFKIKFFEEAIKVGEDKVFEKNDELKAECKRLFKGKSK